jgi:hypothetical protein
MRTLKLFVIFVFLPLCGCGGDSGSSSPGDSGPGNSGPVTCPDFHGGTITLNQCVPNGGFWWMCGSDGHDTNVGNVKPPQCQ